MGHAQGGRGPTTWLRPRLPSTAIIAFHLQWLEPVQTAMRSLFTAKNNTGPQTEHQFCGLLGILVFIFPAANPASSRSRQCYGPALILLASQVSLDTSLAIAVKCKGPPQPAAAPGRVAAIADAELFPSRNVAVGVDNHAAVIPGAVAAVGVAAVVDHAPNGVQCGALAVQSTESIALDDEMHVPEPLEVEGPEVEELRKKRPELHEVVGAQVHIPQRVANRLRSQVCVFDLRQVLKVCNPRVREHVREVFWRRGRRDSVFRSTGLRSRERNSSEPQN
mmetsp:Transcript_79561/g.133283  ORF Transcript_79561/g.133283 Transcript_79561/m.133283 type:complete len:278 (-) Transcript_79561:772-1605(-)|eukprot:CAMPEP_0174361966 /NCGR_PEP_ID=MMETSP0811_2-20130205/61939_1 /TAXON_ID=73025 ORGANISM="Eutreptiella gymnastica-like, Strain CCMP1594" /NCGR_SAMPLE_ID=MMETSP0811_2 /ASSEMBLY_ACC=CAM_ASM_000667 /LENGTH=277 /DNA_ID=CAMNT_0015499137 /DNA_START=334 /DNA_END=1167 /DNA_ORIENTATION=-